MSIAPGFAQVVPPGNVQEALLWADKILMDGESMPEKLVLVAYARAYRFGERPAPKHAGEAEKLIAATPDSNTAHALRILIGATQNERR